MWQAGKITAGSAARLAAKTPGSRRGVFEQSGDADGPSHGDPRLSALLSVPSFSVIDTIVNCGDV